jgi:hypothetical protein
MTGSRRRIGLAKPGFKELDIRGGIGGRKEAAPVAER